MPTYLYKYIYTHIRYETTFSPGELISFTWRSVVTPGYLQPPPEDRQRYATGVRKSVAAHITSHTYKMFIPLGIQQICNIYTGEWHKVDSLVLPDFLDQQAVMNMSLLDFFDLLSCNQQVPWCKGTRLFFDSLKINHNKRRDKNIILHKMLIEDALQFSNYHPQARLLIVFLS